MRVRADRVQTRLKANAQGKQRAKTVKSASLLSGRCFDAVDEPLVASHAVKDERRYRYYVIRDGKTISVGTPDNTRTTNRLRISVPAGAEALGHGHQTDADKDAGLIRDIRGRKIPRTDTLNPGPQAIAAVVNSGIPLYVHHNGRTAVIERTSGGVHIRAVEGEFSRQEERASRQRGKHYRND